MLSSNLKLALAIIAALVAAVILISRPDIVRGADLFSIYEKLGTREMSSTEHARLVAHYEWVKQYRNEYRNIGYTALQCLGKDAPSVEIDFNIHVNAGAKSLL